MQVAVHCKTTRIVEPTLPTLTNVQHCPCCGKQRRALEADGWDHYAVQLNINRKGAIFFLNNMPRALNSLDLTRPLPDRPFSPPRHTEQYTVKMTNSELAEYTLAHLPKHLVHGTTTIQAHCTQCASSFQFLISSPDNPQNPTLSTHHKPLTYCPYCGTNTLVITPTTLNYTERSDNEWTLLANKYSMSPLAIRAIYSFWQAHSTNKSFDNFYHNEYTNALRGELTTKEHIVPRLAHTPTRKLRIVIRKPQ